MYSVAENVGNFWSSSFLSFAKKKREMAVLKQLGFLPCYTYEIRVERMRGIDLWAKSAAAYREKEKICAVCLFLQIANFGSDILFLQTHSFSTQRQEIFYSGQMGKEEVGLFLPTWICQKKS